MHEPAATAEPVMIIRESCPGPLASAQRRDGRGQRALTGFEAAP
jgi:hypothetical protein